MITFRPYTPGFVEAEQQSSADFNSIEEMLQSEHFSKWRAIPEFTELGVIDDMVIVCFTGDKQWVVGHISGDGVPKAEY